MLPIINLTSNRKFKIRNFEEDKAATLKHHNGLRYDGKIKDCYIFSGNFYLINAKGDFIESFEVNILIGKGYPNTFPVLISKDNKIERSDEFHLSKDGIVCLDHTYVANTLARAGMRLYDFVNYYLPKYFSWVLVKQYGNSQDLHEWAHKDIGTIQFYEELLGMQNKANIRLFLENYCKASKISRNDPCYCGGEKKLKNCHYSEAHYLRSTTKLIIKADIDLFR